MASNDGNGAARGLADYLAHEGAGGSSGDGSLEAVRRHALEQLVEARLGADLTAAARRVVAADGGPPSGEPVDGEGYRTAVDGLMMTPSFRALQDAVAECSTQLSAPAGSAAAVDGDNAADVMASKKPGLPEAPAATSFSLFDMLDAQKGGFALQPRITAHQIIEAHRRNKNAEVGDILPDGTNNSTLELLEKADDMEDLSPDPESWEEVRTILYEGMTSHSGKGEQGRYLTVHQSLGEKCRGNAACNAQQWGLAQNLVGSLLVLSKDSTEGKESLGDAKRVMDLCWDIARSLLDALSHLALDLVVSAVGNEREVERMFLGLCMILSNDASACILGMMEPMAGAFEVWARLADPGRVMTIVRASGLGGVALRRCENLGKNASSGSIWEMTQSSGSDAGSGASLADIEHCNFLQSLSILRTILFKCGGSHEVVSLIRHQFTGEANATIEVSSLLSSGGIADPFEVETMLKEVEKNLMQVCNQQEETSLDDATKSVLRPFQKLRKLKECSKRLVDDDLLVLCDQMIQLVR